MLGEGRNKNFAESPMALCDDSDDSDPNSFGTNKSQKWIEQENNFKFDKNK